MKYRYYLFIVTVCILFIMLSCNKNDTNPVAPVSGDTNLVFHKTLNDTFWWRGISFDIGRVDLTMCDSALIKFTFKTNLKQNHDSSLYFVQNVGLIDTLHLGYYLQFPGYIAGIIKDTNIHIFYTTIKTNRYSSFFKMQILLCNCFVYPPNPPYNDYFIFDEIWFYKL